MIFYFYCCCVQIKAVFESCGERWEVGVAVSDKGFQQMSFVNLFVLPKEVLVTGPSLHVISRYNAQQKCIKRDGKYIVKEIYNASSMSITFTQMQ